MMMMEIIISRAKYHNISWDFFLPQLKGLVVDKRTVMVMVMVMAKLEMMVMFDSGLV